MVIQKCDTCERAQENMPIAITIRQEGQATIWAGTSGGDVYGSAEQTFHFCSRDCADEFFDKGYPESLKPKRSDDPWLSFA